MKNPASIVVSKNSFETHFRLLNVLYIFFETNFSLISKLF
jgi:hypothetical protein